MTHNSEDQPAAVSAHSPAQHGALAQEMRGSLGSIGPLNYGPLVTRSDLNGSFAKEVVLVKN